MLLFVAVLQTLLLVGRGEAAVNVDTTCNVFDYGAKGDGKANDTDAILKAFKACAPEKGKSVSVLVPANGTFLVWAFTIDHCDGLSFIVSGIILAPPDPDKWNSQKSAFIIFSGCNGLTLTGGGTINGQGEKWWEEKKKHSSLDPPKLVSIQKSENVLVEQLHLMNSPKFHLVPDESTHVVIRGMTITAPESSPNTDGIDPGGCTDVTITDCLISTGDDNVAIKTGTKDVLIANNTFGYGHGCSIGSIEETGVQNVVVTNTFFNGTEYGARIKTWQGGSGLVKNITYKNLHMVDVKEPLRINMYYCPGGGCKNSSKG